MLSEFCRFTEKFLANGFESTSLHVRLELRAQDALAKYNFQSRLEDPRSDIYAFCFAADYIMDDGPERPILLTSRLRYTGTLRSLETCKTWMPLSGRIDTSLRMRNQYLHPAPCRLDPRIAANDTTYASK